MKKYYISLCLLFVISFLLYSKNLELDSTAYSQNKPEKRWGIGCHPIIGYDSEVKLTLGGAAVIYFEPNNYNQDTDELEINSTYNWANQCDLMFVYNKYFKNNACIIEGEFGYQNYPDDYLERDFNAEYFPFEIDALFKIKENLYFGPLYKFKYSNIDFEEVISEPDFNDLRGAGKTCMSGIGAKLIYKDIPNGQIYRREGSKLELSGIHYSSLIFSDKAFTKLSADYRHYYPILNKSVLAFQVLAKSSFGDLPFNYFPSLDGKTLLRGGESKQAKHFLAGQAEYRFPLFWRLGAAVFIGCGEVENRMKDFGSDICIAGGIGPRITLNKKKDITIRFDFAVNNSGENSVYIKIKEAF